MEPSIFYFDSIKGNDANPGTSKASPLQNVGILNQFPLVSGDKYLLKCGSEWTVTLSFNHSGTALRPITLSSYGSGAKPVIRSTMKQQAAVKLDAGYFQVSNLHLASANKAPGFLLMEDSRNIIIENNEIEQVGIGVAVSGSSHVIRDNYIHDLIMIRNTPGGDDDYGAVGILIYPSDNIKIYRNRIYRCKAHSYDYTTDGGVMETWGSVSNIEFFQNYSEENNGFFEAGSSNRATIADIAIHHNISVNDVVAFLPHLSGGFTIQMSNIDYTNNTFYSTIPYSLGCFYAPTASLTAGQLIVRNNVFSTTNQVYQFIDDGFVHEGNLYYTTSSIHTDSDFVLASSEASGDPLFSAYSVSGYRIGCSSPVIDQGIATSFISDFLGNPTPVNSRPDRGAIESQHDGDQACR